MRFRLAQLCVAVAVSTALTGSAFAQAALDETAPAAAAADPAAPPDPNAEPKKDVEYGVGLRLRNVRVPQFELQLFTERTPGGISNFGIGVDLTRRRGNVELQLGFEFEKITPPEGVWIESGANVPQDEADFILGPDRGSNLGWFTVELTFFRHVPLNKHIRLRYGFGGGLGFLTGSLKRIDVLCAPGSTNDDPDPGCRPNTLPGGQGTPSQGGVPVKYDLKSPVYPVLNAIVGLQYQPTPKSTVNFEFGLRTLLFFGFSGSYFF